jgi:hypothetical protein
MILSIFKKQSEFSKIINLSALEKQDTFIIAKQRINLILQKMAKIKNLKNIPNILSQKFVIKAKNDGT